MKTGVAVPRVVLFPEDDLESLAVTLESVTGELPDATVSVVRPGLPAVDRLADQLDAAGLSVIEVPAFHGLAAVLDRVDEALAGERWIYLFAGERLPRGSGAALRRGAAVVTPQRFPWMGPPPRHQRGRTHIDRAGADPAKRVVLERSHVGANWSMVLGRSIRTSFSSGADVLEDVVLLSELGHLDAAYQRAALAWPSAVGADQVALVRAATLLAHVLELHGSALPVAARWYALEPEPFVALALARIAVGALPFSLVESILARVPADGSVDYRSERLSISAEEHLRIRSAVARQRTVTTTTLEAGVRSFATVGAERAAAGAFGCAFLLGRSPRDLVRRLPADADLALGFLSELRPDLEHDYLSSLLDALRDRFGDQERIDAFAALVEEHHAEVVARGGALGAALTSLVRAA